MNRTIRQLLCIFMLLVSVLTCFASRALAQVGWTQPTIMPNPHRGGGGAAVGPDGRIYVIGGQSPANYVGPIDIYDPARNVWTQGASLPTPRNDVGIVTGPDGLIYAIGGANGSGIVATVEAYNVATDTWTTTTSLPKGRHYLNNSVAVGSDGCIYTIGGRNSSGNPTGDVLAYNTKTKTWTTRTSAPYTDYTTSATAGPDGKIYTAFGNGGGSGSPFAVYDPVMDTWTTLSSLPTSRSQMGIVAGQDGRIYVMGGRLYYYAAFTEVDVYDPVTSQWSLSTAMPRQSWNTPVVSIPDGRLFALGTDEPGGAEPPSTRVDVYHLATTDIFPAHGGKGGQITTTILLNGVQEGATVKLTADKVPDIQGTNTKTFIFTNFKGSSRIQTTFDLTGATLGPRYVVITNPDGTVITLPQQFTVEDLKQPLLQTQVIGRTAIRGGAWTTYNVQVQNTGNVDANAADLRIQFPNYFEWQLTDAKASDTFTGEISTAIGIQLASVPAGGSQVVSLRVKAPDDPKYAHAMFKLFAWPNITAGIQITYIGNLTEGLVFRVVNSSHVTIDYMGVFNATGVVSGIGSLRVTAPDGTVSIITLNSDGWPSRIADSSGNGSTITYQAPTSILFSPVYQGDPIGVPVLYHPIPPQALFTPFSPLPRLGGGPGGFNPCDLAKIAYQLDKWNHDLQDRLGTIGAVLGIGGVFAAADFTKQGLVIAAKGLNLGILAFGEFAGFSYIYDKYHTFHDLGDLLTNYFNCFEVVTSGDPNDIKGVPGFDTAQWVSGVQPLPYTIFFANKPEASAAAQVVKVTSQLDLPGSDLSTLSLGTITIGNQTVTPEDHINPIAGVREYDADVDLRPTKNLLVHVNAKLNLDNGLLTWTFTSLNPATGLPLAPDDPNGFLDPGQEGSMLFTVMPRKNLKTGTIVRNQASIVFDANAAILTPIWFNTIDNDKPTSQVNKLAGVQSSLSFPVSWKGQDVGSGLRDFSIYVSDNGGAWTPWLMNTADTSATFTGVGGHTYAFYSQARDNAFNLENAHPQPDAVTQLPNVATDVSSQVSVTRSAFRFTRATGRFAQTITAKNTGNSAIAGPVSLLLDGLSSNAALFNKTGVTSLVTPAGRPYLTVSAGDMAAGASVTVTLDFTNSDTVKPITYATRVLAGQGSR